MNERIEEISPPMRQALKELEGIIGHRYPTATFDISRGEDDPEVVHLTTTVDLDDPDEVLDLVITRVMKLQVEEKLPLYVIPVRTPERVAALRRVLAENKQHRRFQSPPLSS
jgi:hypothetical protein